MASSAYMLHFVDFAAQPTRDVAFGFGIARGTRPRLAHELLHEGRDALAHQLIAAVRYPIEQLDVFAHVRVQTLQKSSQINRQ